MSQTYISKQTGRVVTVHRISNGCHWYMIPEFTTEQATRSDIFLEAMTRKDTNP